jgi:hypothetical protein
MFLRRLSLIVVLILCASILTGCKKGEKGSSVVKQWNEVEIKICDVLNSIKDKESAEKAIPKLKELAKEFTQAKNEFLKYQKDHPGFEQQYLQESTRIMSDSGKALANFNTNEKIPAELRKEIMAILSL